MPIREIEFISWLTAESRIRHYHCQQKKEILRFMIQLELKIKDKWCPIIRYDNAHNFTHQDIYHWKGKIDKVSLGISDYNIAMTIAEEDLRNNWEIHRERFLKEKGDDT